MTDNNIQDYKNFLLPHASNSMLVEIGVSTSGEVYIFHEKPLVERLNWAEYDTDLEELHFVNEEGKIQNMGFKVNSDIAETVKAATRVFIIHIENAQSKSIVEIPLVHYLNL